MARKKDSIRTAVAMSVKDKQGDRFTPGSLKKLEGKNLSYPVTENFDEKRPVGIIKRLEFKDNMLIATIKLSKKIDLKDKIFRVHGKINSAKKRKNVNAIEEWDLFGVGMIDKKNDVYPFSPEKKEGKNDKNQAP